MASNTYKSSFMPHTETIVCGTIRVVADMIVILKYDSPGGPDSRIALLAP